MVKSLVHKPRNKLQRKLLSPGRVSAFQRLSGNFINPEISYYDTNMQ